MKKGKDYFYHQNYSQAEKILSIPANSNDEEAQYYLAMVYLARKQFDQALIWFKKSGDHGNSQAYFQIGLMHDNGEGVEMNPLTAMDWYRKSKQTGNDFILNDRIKLYEYDKNGEDRQINAHKMFKKTILQAKRGNIEAQYQVAQMLDFGTFTTKNLDEAIKWYQHAAKNGHKGAQFQLGYFFCRGVGVKTNMKTANDWLVKSGHPPICNP